MLELTGVGPDSAAVLLIAAGDNHDHLRDEASFAALCGVSPVERSSGKNQRRRLNRGGNRQANAAPLYRIVLSRLRWEDRSRAYLLRRTAEGKTDREVIRCLIEVRRPRDPPGYRLRSTTCSRQPSGLTSIGASVGAPACWPRIDTQCHCPCPPGCAVETPSH
ncbi:transposase [Streptomyces sp. NPDC004232]|uniref:transposase n=1 Tax=Streptomyces sp. NPDC004232 TaxID=3154454 RepID=UPI0033BF2AF6